MKSIFTRVLLIGATSIIMVHNHPSGDPTLSRADIDMTKRLIYAGRVLDIKVCDSIAVGGSRYESAYATNKAMFES